VKIFTTLARPGVLAVLLALSLACNLLLAGIVVGRIGGHMMHPPRFERGFESGLPDVPEERRAQIRKHLRSAMPEMRERHEAMRELRQALAAELGKPEPDRAAIEQQLAAMRAQSASIQESLHAGFVDTVMDMQPQERKQMMEHMLRERGKRNHRRHDDRGGFAPPPPLSGMPPAPPEQP
jgi:Spy/CpxP family protein refolding chaperone